MLVCDGCDQGFFMHCMGWVGNGRLLVLLVPGSVYTLSDGSKARGRGDRPVHFFRPPGREGPWLSYGWCMMVLFVCFVLRPRIHLACTTTDHWTLY
jgi:hypothetical protein